jgi:hypothetical protein
MGETTFLSKKMYPRRNSFIELGCAEQTIVDFKVQWKQIQIKAQEYLQQF